MTTFILTGKHPSGELRRDIYRRIAAANHRHSEGMADEMDADTVLIASRANTRKAAEARAFNIPVLTYADLDSILSASSSTSAAELQRRAHVRVTAAGLASYAAPRLAQLSGSARVGAAVPAFTPPGAKKSEEKPKGAFAQSTRALLL